MSLGWRIRGRTRFLVTGLTFSSLCTHRQPPSRPARPQPHSPTYSTQASAGHHRAGGRPFELLCRRSRISIHPYICQCQEAVHWVLWCVIGVPSQHTVALFITHLAHSGLRASSVKTYLTAIHHLHIEAGQDPPSTAQWHQLSYVLRGIRRAQSTTPRRTRLPITSEIMASLQEVLLVCLIDHLAQTIVTADQIKKWTETDPQVYRHIQQGWSSEPEPSLKHYYRQKEELSIHQGCLLWGNRIIIPSAGRTLLLDQLHETHPGVSRMKRLARSFVWWPGMHQDIEEKVKKCQWCEEKHIPAKAPIHPW